MVSIKRVFGHLVRSRTATLVFVVMFAAFTVVHTVRLSTYLYGVWQQLKLPSVRHHPSGKDIPASHPLPPHVPFVSAQYKKVDQKEVERSNKSREWFAKHLSYLEKPHEEKFRFTKEDVNRIIKKEVAKHQHDKPVLAVTKTDLKTITKLPVAIQQAQAANNALPKVKPVPARASIAAIPPQNGAQRPLAILNIPDTAGDALLTYLRLLLGCKPCTCRDHHKCLRECPRLINQCGHGPLASMRTLLMQTPPVAMTMLRSPALRLAKTFAKASKHMHPKYGCCGLPQSIVSVFKAGKVDLLQFSAVPGVPNAMTRMLAGHLPSDARVNITDMMYKEALANLQSMEFFGLAECLEDSLMLLRHTLVSAGILPEIGSTKFILQQVATAVRGEAAWRGQLKSSMVMDLERINSYDARLYREAKILFKARLKKLGRSPCQDAK
eukprot:scpid68135/ scgid5032/ 